MATPTTILCIAITSALGGNVAASAGELRSTHDRHEMHLMLYPAIGMAYDAVEGRFVTLPDGIGNGRPLNLTQFTGLSIARVGGLVPLPREFAIYLSDGQEVASLTRRGRAGELAARERIDFQEFYNIDKVDLSTLIQITLEYHPPEDSAAEVSRSSSNVPGPGVLAVFAIAALRPQRRRDR